MIEIRIIPSQTNCLEKFDEVFPARGDWPQMRGMSSEFLICFCEFDSYPAVNGSSGWPAMQSVAWADPPHRSPSRAIEPRDLVGVQDASRAALHEIRPAIGPSLTAGLTRQAAQGGICKAKGATIMKSRGSVAKLSAGLIFGCLLAISGTSAASAQATARYTDVQNQFGTTITLDPVSTGCTGGSIFPPSSIANGGSSGTFNGTTSASSTLCTVRYQSGSFGCQFQISASSSGGLFSSANAYKGSGGRPICEVVTDGPITGGWQATFRMR